MRVRFPPETLTADFGWLVQGGNGVVNRTQRSLAGGSFENFESHRHAFEAVFWTGMDAEFDGVVGGG